MADIAHVLHVVEPYAPSTAGPIELLTRLRAYRHSVAVLGSQAPSLGRTKTYALGEGAAAAWRFWRLLRGLRPQIVHTHVSAAAWLHCVATLAGVRARVHSVHATAALEARTLVSVRRWRDFVHHYVADTRSIEKQLQQQAGLEPGCISQIYAAIEPAAHGPLRERHHAREHYTVAACDDSAQLTLLHAWQRLLRDTPVVAGRAQLIIWLPEALQLQAQQFVEQQGLAACVLQMPSTEQFWQRAAGADVFVDHSMRQDAATDAHAMRLGLPVIACRSEGGDVKTGDPGELLVPGQTGETVRAHDVAALALALREFARHPQKAHAQGRAARLRLMQHFSLESMHNRYRALYQTLLVRSGSGA